MISRYKHISFDLDGTLVHTRAEYRHKIVPEVVRNLGGKTDEESVDAFWFKPDRGKTIRERFGVDPALFWQSFGQMDNPECRGPFTSVYPDVIPVIREMNARDITVSVITGAPKWIADLEVGVLEGISIAHVLALNGSGFSEKPCPDGMHYMLRTLNHAPHETLYVGNGAEDALFAMASGCDFKLVDRKEHALDPQFAEHTIETLRDLLLPR